jgi:pyrrolidone-carboxylate peptidase
VNLIYAFSNRWSTNISARTLLDLQQRSNYPNTIFQKIHGHPKSFFQKHILNKQYDCIIGLGDFFGNLQKIRLETLAKNLYGNRPISTNASFILPLNTPSLSHFDHNNFVLAQNMGSYNCNWIAYQTQLFLNSKDLDTKHLFFHLPKKQSSQIIANIIANFLNLNQVLK